MLQVSANPIPALKLYRRRDFLRLDPEIFPAKKVQERIRISKHSN